MTYQSEFPDFDPATMPAIPAGFEDESWHNDVCPNFHAAAEGLTVWIDYADPALSEFGEDGGARFNLVYGDQPEADGVYLPPPGDRLTVYEGDDYAALLNALSVWRSRVTSVTMSDELTQFCAQQHLTPASADEMLFDDDLTSHQREWLSGFVRRWEAAQDRPGFWA